MENNSNSLEELLNQPEGPRLAFLRERFKPEVLAETLVALANAHGGEVFIGVGGRTRAKIEGVADADAAQEAVQEAALSCTPPLILPLPELLEVQGRRVLRVTVPPGLPNVYSLHGKYLRRQGATNQPLLPDALRRLLSERGEVSWERNAPAAVTLADIDRRKLDAYIRRIGPPAENEPFAFLYRRGCLLRESEPEAWRPTNAGLLLFGHEVERHFPQAEITLVQYRGLDLADEFERVDIRDTLPEALRRAERWLDERVRKGSRMVDFERQDWSQFPPPALRETLVNAVAHRDYTVRGEGIRVALFADRLECYSPGRLPGHVTLENIVEERFSRNETLVQVLADLGLIERLGYGIDRMLRQMQDAGLPPPEFRETAAGFLVILRGHAVEPAADGRVDTSEWQKMGLNERQIAALLHMAAERRITNRELQDIAPDVSAETIRRDLADLVERGLILKVGEKRATYYILK